MPIMAALAALGIDVHIWTMPVEIPDAIAFEQDTVHAAYDPSMPAGSGRRCRRHLGADGVPRRFHRQVSPVHFFWGSFDLAVTRFSGRRAPPIPQRRHPIDARRLLPRGQQRRLWPGDETTPYPGLLCLRRAGARGLRRGAGAARGGLLRPARPVEFRLKYDDVRLAPSPRRVLLEFCQSTYEAAATLATWNRAELERAPIAR